jgi:hypothetical protein
LLEYREDIKENDHEVGTLRNSLPLEQEEKPFLMWFGIDPQNSEGILQNSKL